jgi:hypothetical protein
MPKQGQFKFRKADRIGAADAEEDKRFLAKCFVDTGDLQVLSDCSDSRRLVLGRTGAGKTALLQQLTERADRAILIKPESLALTYVSGSTILQFLHAAGVKLDIFFKLLWRHVFAVELIKHHMSIRDSDEKRGFVTWIRERFDEKRKKYEKALNYLDEWGSSFWEETDYRVKELTRELERKIQGALRVSFPNVALNLQGARSLNESERSEIVQRSQQIVSGVQIQELSTIIELIDDVLDDPQKQYFLIIDRLDENWVEERVRYLLIRAMIETARDFRNVRHAKVVAALRIDLIQRVFRLTRDPGFQEEKYESLNLEVIWTNAQLKELIDLRIGELVRQRYTKQGAKFDDLFPKKIGNQLTFDYMLARTFMRPRDIILFVNECIGQSVSSPEVSVTNLRNAEGAYSRLRLKSLFDEWFADYPSLYFFVDLLKQRDSEFKLSKISDADVEDLCLNSVIASIADDEVSQKAYQVAEGKVDVTDFLFDLVGVFYRIGMVGLKVERHESYVWSFDGQRSISSAELSSDTSITVHPAFWRTLGIRSE